MKSLIWTVFLGAFALVVGCEQSANNPQTSGANPAGAPGETYLTVSNSETSKAPDNTGRNVRDRNGASLTPGDQSGTESDRELTRAIRRAITANDQLSVIAKNIKIITVNGQVTLRGPVKSEEEKRAIEAIVRQAGAGPINNQLEPTPINQ